MLLGCFPLWALCRASDGQPTVAQQPPACCTSAPQPLLTQQLYLLEPAPRVHQLFRGEGGGSNPNRNAIVN